MPLGLGEHALYQSRSALQRLHEALDVDHVDADPNDHGPTLDPPSVIPDDHGTTPFAIITHPGDWLKRCRPPECCYLPRVMIGKGEADYSTVTDLARLRGWSTS